MTNKPQTRSIEQREHQAKHHRRKINRHRIDAPSVYDTYDTKDPLIFPLQDIPAPLKNIMYVVPTYSTWYDSLW